MLLNAFEDKQVSCTMTRLKILPALLNILKILSPVSQSYDTVRYIQQAGHNS